MAITKRSCLLSGAALLGLALTHPAWAQVADAAASADQLGDEIVVTAQRRAERLQDVPLAITALGSATVEDRDIASLENLAGVAPNVSIVQGYAATSVVAIRGGATINPSNSFEPTVGLYVDGVYIGKAAGSAFDISDIDHIEVLRGPQGTLYGRNTLSGAINVTTRKPTGELGVTAKVGYGNYDRQLARINLDLPAIGDLKVKLSGLFDRHDGYTPIVANPFANVTTATPRTIDRTDSSNQKAFRFAARHEPASDMKLDYTFDYSRTKVTPINPQLTEYDAGNIFDPASPFYAGGLVGGIYFGFPLDLYRVAGGAGDFGYQTTAYLGAAPGEATRIQTHSLIAEWAVSDDLTLKSITAHRHMDYRNANDFDGSPLPIVALQLFADYDQFSQEFQATGDLGAFKYTTGLYYFTDDAKNDNPQQIFGSTIIDSRYASGTRAYAAYGQVDYSPPGLEALTLTAGLRYSDERKSTNDRFQQVTVPGATPGTTITTVTVPTVSAHDSFHAFTPSLVVEYAFDRDFNVYARYAKGFKSGGYDGDAQSVAEATRSYRPEKLTSYELGFKSQFLDRRLSFNAAAFYEVHDDLQLSIFLGASAGVSTAIRNAGKASVKGLEAELTARPADWLSFQAGVGYLDAEYDRFVEQGLNIADQRAYPFAPPWTLNASADVRLLRSALGELHLQAEYKHSDSFFLYAYSNDRTEAQNAYSTRAQNSNRIDGRLAMKDIPLGQGRVEAALWVRNLTNDRSRIFGIDFGGGLGGAVASFFDRPRTYGLDLTFRY